MYHRQSQKGQTMASTSADATNEQQELALAQIITARMSHDLNSPIGAIQNGLELLRMVLPEAAEMPEIELMEKSAQSVRAKISVMRLAYGASYGAEPLGLNHANQMLRDYFDGRHTHARIRGEQISPQHLRLAMLLVMLLDRSLPHGGEIIIGSEEGYVIARASAIEGRKVVAPEALTAPLGEIEAPQFAEVLVLRRLLPGSAIHMRHEETAIDVRLHSP